MTDHRTRFEIATVIGLAGGLVALVVTDTGPMDNEAAFLRVAIAGAFLAGLVMAGGFGRAGASGLFWVLPAFVAATVLGAFLACVLVPFDALFTGDMLDGHLPAKAFFQFAPIAPMFIMASVFMDPVTGIAWACGGAAVHVWARQCRGTARVFQPQINL